jgi:DNA-directed RNA polymerase subunit N (RpoN/RPB10)
MGIFDRISKLFSEYNSVDKVGYWVYVRCNRCGENLKSRINLYNDLSVNYDEHGNQTYLCRKTFVGRQGCFERIEVKLVFDQRRKLIDKEISGGTFIESGEYSPIDG